MYQAPSQRLCWNLLLLGLPVTFLLQSWLSPGGSALPLVSAPSPRLLFNTYLVAEGKCHMILGQAFQFHCTFMGQAESQHLELLG